MCEEKKKNESCRKTNTLQECVHSSLLFVLAADLLVHKQNTGSVRPLNETHK